MARKKSTWTLQMLVRKYSCVNSLSCLKHLSGAKTADALMGGKIYNRV